MDIQRRERRSRFIQVLFVVLVFSLPFSNPERACGCLPTLEDNMHAADVVFLGKVIGPGDRDAPLAEGAGSFTGTLVKFEVLKPYKGIRRDLRTVEIAGSNDAFSHEIGAITAVAAKKTGGLRSLPDDSQHILIHFHPIIPSIYESRGNDLP